MLDLHDWRVTVYREHPFSERRSHVASLSHPSLFSAVVWSQNHSRYINTNDVVNATLCCRCVLVFTYTGIVGISGRSADGMSNKLSSLLLNNSIMRLRICRTIDGRTQMYAEMYLLLLLVLPLISLLASLYFLSSLHTRVLICHGQDER